MRQLAEVKDAARRTWSVGDYDAMMRAEGLYATGARLVDRLGVSPGDAVLDVACGTGNATVPAARTGAAVTGVDLTPALLDVARRRADEAGVAPTWVDGDAEDLPFADATFDVVLSTFGCMFAPRHEVVADELARVLRPGGRAGLISWTAEGAIGDFFVVAAPHMPPPPDVAGSPLAWGDEGYVTELFEGTGITFEFERETLDVPFASVEEAVTRYTTLFGPVAEARELAEAEGRWPQMRADLTALFERFAAADGRGVLPAEYLVAVGRMQG